jgi:GAF domain-containing protein
VGAGIRSWLGVPMLHGDRLLGILALDKMEADFYGAIHAQHALTFGALVGWAIDASESQGRGSVTVFTRVTEA